GADRGRRPRARPGRRVRGAWRADPSPRRQYRRRRRPPDRHGRRHRRRLLAGGGDDRGFRRARGELPRLRRAAGRGVGVIVTIDGPAGVGKSTVARAVAQRLGVPYVDTGAMYRELTAVALEHGTAVDDGAALAALVGERPTAGTDIRSERISRVVSAVSQHPAVRQRMRERQRELAGSAAVLEGRDTGTRVCPDADLKIYLTAPVAVRAARRAAQ